MSFVSFILSISHCLLCLCKTCITLSAVPFYCRNDVLHYYASFYRRVSYRRHTCQWVEIGHKIWSCANAGLPDGDGAAVLVRTEYIWLFQSPRMPNQLLMQNDTHCQLNNISNQLPIQNDAPLQFSRIMHQLLMVLKNLRICKMILCIFLC